MAIFYDASEKSDSKVEATLKLDLEADASRILTYIGCHHNYGQLAIDYRLFNH